MSATSRRALFATVFILFLVTPLFVRARMEAALYLSRARDLLADGRIEQASESYRKAISWRSPLDSAPATAAAELLALGRSVKLSPEQRLLALEDLRRGLWSSRSWWWTALETWSGPSAADVQQEIDTLVPPPPDYVREANPPKVDFFFQALSQLFFWGWIGCVLSAIWQGFDRSGRMVLTELFPRLGCAAVCFVAWLLALGRA